MKLSSAIKLICVFILLVMTLANSQSLSAQDTGLKPLNQILNPDGTINTSAGNTGSFDSKGFMMTKGAGGEPIFLPSGTGISSVQASGDENWDDKYIMDGVDKEVNAVAIDAIGNVYIGGRFNAINGDLSLHYIAKWDGNGWSPLGSGVNSSVYAIAVSGSDVYVGGYFTTAGGSSADHIAKWDGNNWSALGSGVNSLVMAITVSESDVYVGGNFTTAGGISASRIAKWDGSSWSALESGVNDQVIALAVSGNDLYVGGRFDTAGGILVNKIAKWDGNSWSALESGVNNIVYAIAVSGSDVYVGGYFSIAGGISANGIAKWNGSSWLALGGGVSSVVYAIGVSGSDIYVGGYFTTAGGVSAQNIAKWNGSTWFSLDSGVGNDVGSFPGEVNSIAVRGSTVYVGGRFETAGDVSANRIAKWNGSNWISVGQMLTGGQGLSNDNNAIAISGDNVYTGGMFTTAGGNSANCIAKWNGSSWSTLDSGVSDVVRAIAVSGSNTYVGGRFRSAGGVSANKIAKWDGSSWSALGSGVNSSVWAIAVSGNNVYAGGWFDEAGGSSANHIAMWNGSNWSALENGVNNDVYAIAISGNDVYVGGNFSEAGGSSANFIAKWDGNGWSTLDGGVNNTVHSIAVIGNDVYVGGGFTIAGGVNTNRIAKWNGSSWSALGSGVSSTVYTIAVSGSDVYVGGYFTTAGGVSTQNIAKWNGSSWSTLGNGVSHVVRTIAVSGSDVYVGGDFTIDGGKPSSHFGRYSVPEPTAQPTNISFSNITTYSFTVSFTAAADLPDRYIAIRRASASPTFVPVDGTTYTIGQVVGNGKVAYIGNSVSFNETGLSEGTSYYYNIFSFNGSGSSSKYLTTAPLVGSQSTLLPTSDLFFSEYIEGSFNNKALEIYNPTNQAIDLGNYCLFRANNGSAVYQDSLVFPAGRLLEPDSVYVIGNSSAAQSILNLCDTIHTITFYNGDDHLAIAKKVNSKWVVIDVMGVLGEDPGVAWDVAGVTEAMAEHTLIRNSSVKIGTTNWAISSGTNSTNSQWIVLERDNFSFLGTHTQSLTPVISVTPDSLNFGTTLIDFSASKPLTISNTGSDSLHIESIDISGNIQFERDSLPKTPFTIAAGGDTVCNIKFAPTGTGKVNATLQILSDDPERDTLNISLTGSGIASRIGINPASLNFGMVDVTEDSSQNITITNITNSPLEISVVISGGDSIHFKIDPIPNQPIEIPPNGSTVIGIKFKPLTYGDFNIQLMVSGEGSDIWEVAVPLSGTGKAPDIHVVPEFIDFGKVVVGQADTAALSIHNLGNSGLRILGLSIFGSDLEQFDFAPHPGIPIDINAGDSVQVNIKFEPSSEGDKLATILISSNDLRKELLNIPVQGQGIGRIEDNQPPTINPVPPDMAYEKNPFTIRAIVNDNIGIDKVLLYYRSGGDPKFNVKEMTKSNGEYQASIQGDSVTSHGLEYRLTASDMNENHASHPQDVNEYHSIRVQIGEEGLPPKTCKAGEYQMVSIPLDANFKSPDSIFSDLGVYNKKQWRLFELLPQEDKTYPDYYAEYKDISQIVPGKGYWLIVKDAGKSLKTGSGKTNRTDREYPITLHKNWNIVANPFDFSIPVINLRLASGAAGHEIKIRDYDGAPTDPYTNDVDSIRSFAGYMVETKSTGDTLYINPDLTVMPKHASQLTKLSFDWAVHVTARCGQARDIDNYAAVRADGATEWDILDYTEPPPIGNFISLFFPHDDWQINKGNYCIDTRKAPVNGDIWKFAVQSNIKENVELSFADLSDIPAYYQLYLVDELLQTTQNLRKETEYEFTATGLENIRNFKLIIGKDQYVKEQIKELNLLPASYVLYQNFPNPFNQQTTIRYALPAESRVTLKVYNLLGQEVKTLLNQINTSHGYHAEVWDGTSQAGNSAASGIYVYYLQTDSFVQYKKMILLR